MVSTYIHTPIYKRKSRNIVLALLGILITITLLGCQKDFSSNKTRIAVDVKKESYTAASYEGNTLIPSTGYDQYVIAIENLPAEGAVSCNVITYDINGKILEQFDDVKVTNFVKRNFDTGKVESFSPGYFAVNTDPSGFVSIELKNIGEESFDEMIDILLTGMDDPSR